MIILPRQARDKQAPAPAPAPAARENSKKGPFFLRERPSFLKGDTKSWRGVFALGAQGTGFPYHLHGDAWLELLAGCGRQKLAFFGAIHLCSKNDQFTKTGSGQR
jgi:hypothetical protein